VEVRERQILYYVPSDGSRPPFRAWFECITDVRTRAAVAARIARLRGGNFGDSQSIAGGMSESRIHFGPGYRIYYAIDGPRIVLLCAGDKSSQRSDIENAKKYWRDYKERRKIAANRGLQGGSPGRTQK